MSEKPEITFYAGADMRAMLAEWAKAEDRSVSYIIRQCILSEQKRRAEREIFNPITGKAVASA